MDVTLVNAMFETVALRPLPAQFRSHDAPISPMKLQTKKTNAGEERGRRQVAEKYLEVAELIDSEDDTALNVCVGVASSPASRRVMRSVRRPSVNGIWGRTMMLLQIYSGVSIRSLARRSTIT